MSNADPPPAKTPAIVPSPIAPDSLRRFTEARVAIGRAGASLTTRAHLQFVGDHARARDAVWTAVDFDVLARELEALGVETVRVESRANDRAAYLRRPDLGRRLSDASVQALADAAVMRGGSVALVIGDGLSAEAVQTNAAPVIAGLLPLLAASDLAVRTVVLAAQARVAIGDAIARALGAALVIVLIGERPGLSAADSLGCYITWEPQADTPDSRRNCISNIRAGGLAPAEAAKRIAKLAAAACARRVTGIELKDEGAAPVTIDELASDRTS